MSCILRFSAPDCDIDAIVSNLKLDVYGVYRQGEPKQILRLGVYGNSGLQIVASEAEFDEFQKQVSETTAFIKANLPELLKLGQQAQDLPGSHFLFDFGINTRMYEVGVQCDYFPAELVRLIGTVGAGIELSQYPPPSEEEVATDIEMQ